MDGSAYLRLMDHELRRFGECLGDDLTVPVEHCGDWTLYDLADHHGRGNLWSAAAVTERRPDYEAPPAPHDPRALRTWFDQTRVVLLSVLDTDPDTEAWTFYPPHTVGFWQRRRCQEALVHRWDAEHATGQETDIDPALAADGVSEVFDTMSPRQVKRGRAAEPECALRFTATDTGNTWTHGPGDAVAGVSGTAADLLLLLWGRRTTDHPTVTVDGDEQAAARWLANSLVP